MLSEGNDRRRVWSDEVRVDSRATVGIVVGEDLRLVEGGGPKSDPVGSASGGESRERWVP